MHLHKEVPEQVIRDCIKNDFLGKIKQVPPIRSAVKRRLRTRTIYYLEIMEVEGKEVLFKVGCEAGTYIRKLCLHPKTKILTEKGSISVSEFYSNPQKIYSYYKGKMIEKNPSATQKLKSPVKLIKLTMDTGISFIITQDHKMLMSIKKG